MRKVVALCLIAACSNNNGSSNHDDLSTSNASMDLAGADLSQSRADLASGDMTGFVVEDMAMGDLGIVSPSPSPTPSPPLVSFDGQVDAILHAGDAWYFGGRFSRAQPFRTSGLVVVDGSHDPGCDLGLGFGGSSVYAVVQVGSSIYVGGNFSSYDGQTANNLAKIDATTCALDPNFSPQSGGNGFDNAVTALATDGTWLYVGGNFGSYRGVPQSAAGIARLALGDGALNPLFGAAGANGFNGGVSSLVIIGSSLYAGGSFTSYHGAGNDAKRLAKIDLTNGLLDASFSPPSANGFDNLVLALATDAPPSPTPTPSPGPYLYVGGTFHNYDGDGGGHSASFVAKLDTSGKFDTTFGAGVSGTASTVRALAVGNGSLYLGGDFGKVGSTTPVTGLAKIALSDGTVDIGFSPAAGNGVDDTVYALAFAGGSLYVGGAFNHYYRGGDTVVNHLIQVHPSTGLINATFAPTGAQVVGVNDIVYAISSSGARLNVGGQFTAYGGLAANRIAKFDGTSALDATFTDGPGGGFDDEVFALAASGTSIYAGGSFSAYRGVAGSASALAMLDQTSGDLNTTFSPPGASNNGFDDDVQALAVYGDSLYAGGFFSAYRNAPSSANGIAKLNLASGDLNTTFSPPGANGFDGQVYALAIAPSPSPALIVGGSFSNSFTGGTKAINNIAKVNLTSGVADTTFSPTVNGFDDSVFALAVSDDAIFAGGSFGRYRNVANSANGIAKLNPMTGELDTMFSPNPTNGFSGTVDSLIVVGSSVYAGGSLTGYRGDFGAVSGIAKLDVTGGDLDPTFSSGGFAPGSVVYALGAQSSFVVAGGNFLVYRGQRAWFAATLDATSGALK